MNAPNGAVRIGVLNAQDQVVPIADATANRIFARTTANIVSAFLQIVPGAVPPAPTGADRRRRATRRCSWVERVVRGDRLQREALDHERRALCERRYRRDRHVVHEHGTGERHAVFLRRDRGERERRKPGLQPGRARRPRRSRRRGDGHAVTCQTSPWYNDQQVRLTNTGTLTALTVTVVIQRTAGITRNGQYNTVGGQIQQTNTANSNPALTYTWTLAPGRRWGGRRTGSSPPRRAAAVPSIRRAGTPIPSPTRAEDRPSRAGKY